MRVVTPLATKLLNLLNKLSNCISDERKNSEEFKELHNFIIEKSFELEAVDGKIDQIRKIITPHVTKSIDQKYKEDRNSSIFGWLWPLVVWGITKLATMIIS